MHKRFWACIFIVCIVLNFLSQKALGINRMVIQPQKVIMLITAQDTWEQWRENTMFQTLVSQSGIGCMNIRTNHKKKIDEYYGTINAGRRWSYTEKNNSGAVENGLGDLLHQHGFSTALFTNNSKLKLILENRYGQISFQSNVPQLFTDTNKDVFSKSDVILIDWDFYKNQDSENQLLDFICHHPVQVYIICPYSKDQMITPVLMYNSESTDQGLLRSSTTKRTGIITNLDIVPTITQYLGIDGTNFVGKPLTIKYDDQAYKILQQKIEKMEYVFLHRGKAIKIFIISMLLTVILFYPKYRYGGVVINQLINGCCWTILWIPMIFLLIPIMNIQKGYMIFICGVVVFLFGYFIHSPRLALKIISLTTVVGLSMDVALGAKLQSQSLLGYSPIIGARFYGIGNEYAGILIGSFFVLLYSFSNIDFFIRMKNLFPIFLIVVLALPSWGANVGGTIAAVCGSIAYWIKNNNKYRFKTVLGWFIGSIFIVGAIWIFADFILLTDQSHLGQTMVQFFHGNTQIVLEIIKRKIEMNLQLIKNTFWTKFLWMTLILLGIFYKKEEFFLEDVGIPILCAMTGAIIFNDSGIIMASTCIIYLVFPYLYLYNQNEET